MDSTIAEIPAYARNLSRALVRMTAERDAIRLAYHASIALLRDMSLEADGLRGDRDRLLDELRQQAEPRGQRRGRAA